MMLHIFNTELKRIAILKSYKSLMWTERYAKHGTLTLECEATPENLTALKENHIVTRARLLPERKGNRKIDSMIITEVLISETDNLIVASGVGLLWHLDKRIVERTMTVTNLEQGAYGVISANLRGLEHQTLGAPKGLTASRETQFTGNSLLDVLEKINDFSGYGFRNWFDVNNRVFIFDVYNGQNLSVKGASNRKIFKTEFKNLSDLEVTADIFEHANIAYVAGEGEGADRIWIKVALADGLADSEMFVDARDLQRNENESLDSYKKRLEARGQEKLKEHNVFYGVQGVIDTSTFGLDYWLGDVVAVVSDKYQISGNKQITSFTITFEQGRQQVALGFDEGRTSD